MADGFRRPPEGSGARRGGVVSCWMCGIRLHASKMMPDGGDRCDDIRWYCRNAKTCTQRWTTSRRVLSADAEESQETAPHSCPRGASHRNQAAPVIGEVAPAASG